MMELLNQKKLEDFEKFTNFSTYLYCKIWEKQALENNTEA